MNANTTPASPAEGLSKSLAHDFSRWTDLTDEIERLADTGEVPSIFFVERDALIDGLMTAEPTSAADLAAMSAMLLHYGEEVVEGAAEVLRNHARRLLGLPAIGAA